MMSRFNINESEKARILGLYGLNGVNIIKEQDDIPKKVIVTVVDEEGNPLKGVRVTIVYKSYAEKLDWYRKTNEKGEFKYKLRNQKVKLLKFELDGYRDVKRKPLNLLDKGNKVTLVKKTGPDRPPREEIMGCMDPKASNYNQKAWVDCKGNRTEDEFVVYKSARDGEEWVVKDVVKSKADMSCCEYAGCTDKKAYNYNKKAVSDDGSCLYSGCMDKNAENYDPKATKDSGKCKAKKVVQTNDFLEFVTVDWEIKGDLLLSLDNLVDAIVRCRFILHMLEFWYKSNKESCKDRSVKLSNIKGKLISGGVEDSLRDLDGLLGRLNKKTGLPNDVARVVSKLLDEATSLYKKVDRRWNKIERIKKTGEPNVDRYMLKSIRRSLVKSYNDSEKAISIINGIKCP
jgi:hypothetical protein